MARKVIITAALSGSMTMKEHNPAVPYTPEEFVREAKQAEDAGAAIVHIHFRDPTGIPTTEPAIMQDVVQGCGKTPFVIELQHGCKPRINFGRAHAAHRPSFARYGLAQPRHDELLHCQLQRRQHPG
jgi:uncharacterized protein (DUF849 family)